MISAAKAEREERRLVLPVEVEVEVDALRGVELESEVEEAAAEVVRMV